jgi:hypothetical protein
MVQRCEEAILRGSLCCWCIVLSDVSRLVPCSVGFQAGTFEMHHRTAPRQKSSSLSTLLNSGSEERFSTMKMFAQAQS